MARQSRDVVAEKVANWEYIHGIFMDIIGDDEVYPYMRKVEDLERWFTYNQHYDLSSETITLSKKSWDILSEIVTRKPCINSKMERKD